MISRTLRIATLLALLSSSSAFAEPFLDRLPFKVAFSGHLSLGRSGRLGRPLRPVEEMDSNSRDIWQKHPYLGPKITVTFPF